MNHRSRSKIVFTFVLGIFVIGGALYLVTKGGTKEIAPSADSVKFAQSDNAIYFDFALDGNGNIHLVWQSKEQGLQYQKKTDLGNMWSQPILIPQASVSLRSHDPRIIANGNTIQIFWLSQGLNQQTSFDSGTSWTDMAKKILPDVPVREFEIDSEGKQIYLVYNNREGTFFLRSDNFGEHWTPPERIARYIGTSTVISRPAITVSDHKIHVLWSQLDTRTIVSTGISQGKLFYLRSNNLGRSWEDFREISVKEGDKQYDVTYSILYPRITTAGNSIFIFYEERELLFQVSADQGSTWSAPVVLSRVPVRGISLAGTKQEEAHLVWIDERHQKREWWSYIPAHAIITWAKDPYWANNDLYYTSFLNGSWQEPRRLTLPLSYVGTHPNAIAVKATNGTIYVFWSGRKKVGKTLDQYSLPNEIFFTTLDGFD